jgi:hypothetical protein
MFSFPHLARRTHSCMQAMRNEEHALNALGKVTRTEVFLTYFGGVIDIRGSTSYQVPPAEEIAPAKALDDCSPVKLVVTVPSVPTMKKVGVELTPYSLNIVPEES